MTIPNTNAASLQGWGRNVLPKIGPAMQSWARKYGTNGGEGETTDDAIARTLQTVRTQSETELPAESGLTAEIQSITAEVARIKAEQEALNQRRRTLASRAESLPTTYKRLHAEDERRVYAPRKSSAVEKRADLSAAETEI